MVAMRAGAAHGELDPSRNGAVTSATDASPKRLNPALDGWKRTEGADASAVPPGRTGCAPESRRGLISQHLRQRLTTLGPDATAAALSRLTLSRPGFAETGQLVSSSMMGEGVEEHRTACPFSYSTGGM